MDAVVELMSAARLVLQRRLPHLEPMLLKLVPREWAEGTVGVSESGFFLYDPRYIVTKTKHGLAADYGHEVCHVVFDTVGQARRYGVSDSERWLWNIGGDLVINPLIRDAGMPIEEGGCVFPADYGLPEGLTHAEYFERLKALPKAWKLKLKLKCGQCGSAAGHTAGEEPPADDEDARLLGELEQARIAVAENIRTQLRATKGRSAESWLRWADGQLAPPRIAWERKLMACVRRGVNYSRGLMLSVYDGRARRQRGLGYGPGRPMIPTTRGARAQVEVWFDTSASMQDNDLLAGLSELCGLLRMHGARVQFGSVDTDIRSCTVVETIHDVKAHLRGGGGTDFTAVFERWRTLPVHTQPDLVVFITDGEAYGVPNTPPKFPFIWLCVRGGRPPCLWGECIDVV